MSKNCLLGLAIFVAFCCVVSAQGPAAPAAQTLPAGDAKAIVSSACTTCHAETMITSTGHTREDWKLLVERMVSAGADVPPNQMSTVTDYLTKNFPEKYVPPAVLVPGSIKVTLQRMESADARLAAARSACDSRTALWYTGQYANVLGRVDTKTGEIKEFPFHRRRVRPPWADRRQRRQHLVHRELEGLHRQAGSENRQVHRVQAAGGRARSAYAAVRSEGHAWFTVQGANMVGRLDPKQAK